MKSTGTSQPAPVVIGAVVVDESGCEGLAELLLHLAEVAQEATEGEE